MSVAPELTAAVAVESGAITATVVVGSERGAFLGRLFGGFKHCVERHVVRALTELCGCGTLGAWEFVSLSTGGGYLRPPTKLYGISAPNFMQGSVSADVAGIVAS